MSWSESPLTELVIPEDAADTDSRIEIGTGTVYSLNPARISYKAGTGSYVNDEITHSGNVLQFFRNLYAPSTAFPGSFISTPLHTESFDPATGRVTQNWVSFSVDPSTGGYASLNLDSGVNFNSFVRLTAKNVDINPYGTLNLGEPTTAPFTQVVNLNAPVINANGALTVTGAASAASLAVTNAISAASATLAGLPVKPCQTSSVNVSFTSLTSFTVAVNFPTSFTQAPVVVTNINSGSGSTARWVSRAISVTTTGFTLFVFAADAAVGTWSNIPVTWQATGI